MQKENKSTKSATMLLVLILLAIFVVPSSISGTAIALPAIAIDTNASLTSLQWVVNAFNLMFACLTLAWGALADGLGRKRCFLAGVLIYGGASLISGIAPNTLTLDVGRALAGVGAAAVFSCGIALLSTNFEGPARLRVFALFGTVAGLGVSLGPTISGLLLDTLGWRAIFYTHTIILFFVVVTSRAIPSDKKSTEAGFKFDFAGAALFVLALFVLMVAIVQSSQWGWNDHRIAVLLAGSVVLFAVFWRQERRHSAPMLDLSLLGNGPFVGYSLVTVAGSFGFVTLLTYFPTYVTSVLNMTATGAGVTMLLLTAPMLVCPIAAGRLVAGGVSSTFVLIASLVCLLAGLVGLTVISEPAVPVIYLAIPLLLVGAGYGLAAGLVDGLALHVLPEEKAGMGAGLLNTFRLGSEAIAVSLYGSTLAVFLHNRLQPKLSVLDASALTIQQWVNDVAAGNFGAVVPTNGALSVEQIGQLVATGYDGAFHGVLLLLFAVVLLLTLLIVVLIRNAQKDSQVELEVG